MLCKAVHIAKIRNGCVLGIGLCTARLCGNPQCSGWKKYTAKLCRKLRIVHKENENLTFVTPLFIGIMLYVPPYSSLLLAIFPKWFF